MSRKRWSYRLSRPIPVKDGPTLRTLDDVRMFMLDNLPEEDQARRSWQKACEILLAAADGLADVRAATRQVAWRSVLSPLTKGSSADSSGLVGAPTCCRGEWIWDNGVLSPIALLGPLDRDMLEPASD
jgi:hypothetical protein